MKPRLFWVPAMGRWLYNYPGSVDPPFLEDWAVWMNQHNRRTP